MRTKEEIIEFISKEIDVSEGWVFLTKKTVGDKMQSCILSPDQEQAMLCVMHWLRQEQAIWESLKSVMEQSIKK